MKKQFVLFLSLFFTLSVHSQVYEIGVPSLANFACFCMGAPETAMRSGHFFLMNHKDSIFALTATHVISGHKKDDFISVRASKQQFSWKEKIADSFNDIALYPNYLARKEFPSANKKALIPNFLPPKVNEVVYVQTSTELLKGKVTAFGKGIPNQIGNLNIIECQFPKIIAEGYSGAPLLNQNKEVIGIITEANDKGNAFAMGGEYFQKSVEDLLLKQHIRRPYLGVALIENNKQVMVKGLMAQSPARNAGLKEGDIIVSINEKKVHSLSEVITELDKCHNKSQISLQLSEGNRVIRFTVGDLVDKTENVNKEYANFPIFFFAHFTPENGRIVWLPDNPAINLVIRFYKKDNPNAYAHIESVGTDCDFKRNFQLSHKTWDDLGEALRICSLFGKMTFLIRDKDSNAERFTFDLGESILFY